MDKAAATALREQRFYQAELATAKLLHQGIYVFCPILHCHNLAKSHSLPTDANFWRDYNFAMLKPAAGLFILRIDGWDTSVGIAAEIAFAKEHKIPISRLAFALEISSDDFADADA